MSSSDLEPVVYRELRAMAGAMFRTERPNHTLQPTALVHEAWLRLAGSAGLVGAGDEGRRRFLGVAANVMRQLLVDHARSRGAGKRGGGWDRVSFGGELPVAELDAALLLDLDAALTELAKRDARAARVAELRVFGGLQIQEIVEVVGRSLSTVKSDWALARAVLSRALSGEQ